MSRISILVAATTPDIKAEGIRASVAQRSGMQLLRNRVLLLDELERAFHALSDPSHCALVLVGPQEETGEITRRLLARYVHLVVLQVDIIGDNVNFEFRDPELETLLDALTDLVERVEPRGKDRLASVQLNLSGKSSGERPLLQTSFRWLHSVLRAAVERVPEEDSELHGLSLTRAALLEALDSLAPQHLPEQASDAALTWALKWGLPTSDPLAVIVRALDLGPLDFRLLLLALAPELDDRYQRCFGFLLNDMGRRTGTMGLYCGLLGEAPGVCTRLAQSALVRWYAFDQRVFSADVSLPLDAHLARWILGDRDALTCDPRVRRVSRPLPWQGYSILARQAELGRAAEVWRRLLDPREARWLVLGKGDPADWRAILELGAFSEELSPTRVELSRLGVIDLVDVEECAIRTARSARLMGSPLVIDASNLDDDGDGRAELFLGALGRIGSSAAVICRDEARIVRLLGPTRFDLMNTAALSTAGRVAAIRSAAAGADAPLTEEAAEGLSLQYPLPVDALEQAMRLALARPTEGTSEELLVGRFQAACRERAVEGLSYLAEPIEPVFQLDNIVLPADRKSQLEQIIDHVRLAPKVLDDWKFGEQLPYGRGVSALFFGPSGTGKTMAAMGIARELGIQLLRIDLSRVVSKYIGDTEKNIDHVFSDAQRSGAAILIDEAEALLGKRSDVKDAHDRYANIEVAYLLQRMETYEGLAILTSNLKHNLDPAFLRRLRFVVEFPRPDAEAREDIWRFCLPDESHELDKAAFRQLARKIDLTGGHIRQITLQAAFLAAAAGVRINLEHIAEAARAEFAKLGMPPVEIDVTGRRAA